MTVLVSVSNEELKDWLGRALCGLHTMKDEHFGISVVELMVLFAALLSFDTTISHDESAGVVPIAHNSAGPKEDIVVRYKGQSTGIVAWLKFLQSIHTIGYLCTTKEEYSEALADVFSGVVHLLTYLL